MPKSIEVSLVLLGLNFLMMFDCSKCSILMMENVTDGTFSAVVTPEMDSEGSVISDRFMTTFMYSSMVIQGTISTFGSVSNLINMIIFYRLGIKDSMSVGLVALSFTDFLVTLLGLGDASYYVWELFFPDTVVEPISLKSVAWGWWRNIFQLISMWVTTFLSIERCICVVFPFKVKQIFTRMRSIIIIIFIYIIIIAVHMPVIATMWLGWTQIKVNVDNETVFKDRLVIMYTDNRPQIQLYIDVANGTVLPFPSQILVIISVVWMIYGLRSTSQIRIDKTDVANVSTLKKDSKLSEKERKLVRVVLFLAIILTFSNVPRFVAVYSKQIYKEVYIGGVEQNMYVLLWGLTAYAGIINSSVNVFVYLLINRSYLAEFKQLFKCKTT